MQPTIPALGPITSSVIDFETILQAGEPGTPQRVMVFNALALVNRIVHDDPQQARFPQHFVRTVIRETMVACWADQSSLPRAPMKAITVIEASNLIQQWGLFEVPVDQSQPGDVLVFNDGVTAVLLKVQSTLVGSSLIFATVLDGQARVVDVALNPERCFRWPT